MTIFIPSARRMSQASIFIRSGDTNYAGSLVPPTVPAQFGMAEFAQPFTGPSGLRFNAVAGQTYYFAVDKEAPRVPEWFP